jgi:hypothetical protein
MGSLPRMCAALKVTLVTIEKFPEAPRRDFSDLGGSTTRIAEVQANSLYNPTRVFRCRRNFGLTYVEASRFR